MEKAFYDIFRRLFWRRYGVRGMNNCRIAIFTGDNVAVYEEQRHFITAENRIVIEEC